MKLESDRAKQNSSVVAFLRPQCKNVFYGSKMKTVVPQSLELRARRSPDAGHHLDNFLLCMLAFTALSFYFKS